MIEINNKKLCESCFCEANGEPCPNCGFSAAEYSQDPIVLPMGTRLNDKIIIGKVMGKGGFGITYLGYDLRIDKTIAVKEYYPNGITYRSSSGTKISIADAKSTETFETGAKKFYTEAEMVAQFNGNPNIVSVYDYFRANNTVYLVMEFIEGITLKNYIKKHGRLTDGQALFVMDKIAAALSITHSAGVLHRDISPDNIMICKDGKIKLIDFGAARQIMSESSSNLTVVMKPGYTPIEQYTKKGVQGAWTDIYSLGASVYYALTEIVIDDPYARIDDDDELAENKHGINSDLWEILKKCTMINASDRYDSAIELRNALKSVSAPMMLEPIQLNDDDLKPTESKADSGEPDKVTKKSSTATADTKSKSDEVIEAPEVAGAQPAGKDIRKQKDISRRRKKAKSKKPFIIAAAAVAAIIAAIAIIVGINIFSEKSLYIPLDNGHEGELEFYEVILKDDLKEFKGDIKITLDIEHIIPNTDAELYIEDYSGRKIDIQAYNCGRDIRDIYSLPDGQTEFPFIITREEFNKVEWQIRVRGSNLRVKGATIENYDPKEDEISPNAKIIQLDSEYPGTWQNSSEIPKEELEAFNGDVRVTLMIETIRADEVEDTQEYWVQIIALKSPGGEKVHIKPDYIAPASWSTDGSTYSFGEYAVPDKFTFIITADEIDKIDKGLYFVGSNIIVKSAALEKAG